MAEHENSPPSECLEDCFVEFAVPLGGAEQQIGSHYAYVQYRESKTAHLMKAVIDAGHNQHHGNQHLTEPGAAKSSQA